MTTSAAVPMKEETIQGADGTNLFMRSWRGAVPTMPVRAVVMIVPGFNSHSGYYEWVGAQLAAQDLAVFAIDLRGRGESDGERFYVKSFDEYISDVDAMAAEARAREPGVPVFILGHSAGGVISCMYTLEHQDELAGLICESFAFQLPAPDVALSILKGIAHLAPHAHVLKLKNADFSRDPDVVRRMNSDPLIANETQPTQTVAEMVRTDERLKESFPQFTLPLMILHGTHDKAAKPSGSESFFQSAGAMDKTLRLYDGHYHDLLNDLGREEVLGDIAQWIKSRLPVT
jgi:alpha-beta hydrolase superfamily lysophospholipase